MPPRNPMAKTLVIPLFEDLFLRSDGTTSYRYVEVEVPDLETLGPQIESMYLCTVTKNHTSTDHAWNVALSGSNSGRTWSTPTEILTTDITAEGEAVHAAYTDAQVFGWLRLKVLAATRNASAGSAESGLVSAWLVVTLKT